MSALERSLATEADLLSCLVRQREEPVAARTAWEELFFRHRRYLFVVVDRAYGSFLGKDGSADLVVDVLRRAYEWAGRQPDAAVVRQQFTGKTPEATRRLVLGWFGAIAARLFQDSFRAEAERSSDLAELAAERMNSEAERGAEVHPRSAGLDEALASLSQAERDALQASLGWYDPETESFAVPKGEAARMAQRLGTTPEALRQRRFRAIQKLETWMTGERRERDSSERSGP